MENETIKTTGANGEALAGQTEGMSRQRRPFFPLPMPKIRVTKRAKIVSAAILVAVALLALAYQYRGVFVAATVDGVPITRIAVIRDLEKQSGKEALDTLVTKTLITNAALAANVTVSQEDIDAELGKIEEQVSAQGMTLEDALAQQGLTREVLVDQVVLRKQLEKVLADKIAVTDEEVADSLKKNARPPQAGTSSEDQEKQARDRLVAQKFSVEADKWVTEAKEKAQIDYFIEY